jgi:hypothetical protein
VGTAAQPWECPGPLSCALILEKMADFRLGIFYYNYIPKVQNVN